ncbi:hypothetical protein O0L34_g16524 [Tuta absoluta]|nr:hypothetical protein O0L34_g16524 [Tuta absoluta]
MLLNKFFSGVLVLRVANVYSSTMSTSGLQCKGQRTKFLSQTEAGALDQELFTDYKFSVDQLMELAGLSVATAIAKAYPHCTYKTALIVCGPGNNGGDGLVAARHMALFGYRVSVYYPKRTPKPLYENLLEQCKRFGVIILEELPTAASVNNDYKLLVDALFGFSFKPPVRDELKPVLNLLIDSTLPICSVDIPSGWDVEKGPLSPKSIKPAMLISLSAPKMCARQEILLDAKHYLGGRFLPPEIVAKYNLTLPEYPNQEQVVLLSC